MLQEFFNKLLIYQIGLSPQFFSDIFTAQSTSSRLFVTASLSSGDRQDVSCLYRCFRTEFFNVKEQLYASYKKKRKNTLENELKQKEIALNSNYCLSYCASSSTLFWLSGIFFPSPYQILPMEFFTSRVSTDISWKHKVLQLCYTEVIPNPTICLIFSCLEHLLYWVHLCSSVTTFAVL